MEDLSASTEKEKNISFWFYNFDILRDKLLSVSIDKIVG
jgi:hypothetical protein